MAAAGFRAFYLCNGLPVPHVHSHNALGLPGASCCPQIAETQRQLQTLSVTFLALELGSWEPLASLQVEQEQMQSRINDLRIISWPRRLGTDCAAGAIQAG